MDVKKLKKIEGIDKEKRRIVHETLRVEKAEEGYIEERHWKKILPNMRNKGQI